MLVTLTCILGKDIFSQEKSQSDILQNKHKNHKHPFPLQFDSTKVGCKDSEILKKFGEGIFDPNDGHLGARYFRDSNKKTFLKITIGVDPTKQ